ncbi:TonB-dependent receptor domain-containing protein [Sorangium sp. So ce854]|uniref:TonB-dependent receptor plug domain-containing protein n=1 Tax=Sorangium sp. So ce854 TaxID=3133322 RepID=UPI003F5FC6BE
MSSSDSCSHGRRDARPALPSTNDARAAQPRVEATHAARPRAGATRAALARRLCASAVLLGAMTAARGALADARTEARLHFRAGMELIAQKQFEEGIRQLQKANEILPHPNVVFNIARAHAEAGNIEQAIAAYREYLASDPPDREQVTRIVAQLEQRLAAQRAAAAPEPRPPAAPAPQQPGPQQPGPQQPAAGDTPAQPTAGQTAAGGAAAPGGAQGPGGAEGPAARPAPGPGAAPVDAAGLVGAARTEDVYRETVITASRGAQSPLDSPNSTTIVTRQDIRLSGMTRIPELLRRVAGMDVMQITGGDENVSMRGFNSRLANKLLVLVDGRTVKNDVLGSTFWEALSIDVDQIERIEVVRGPGSALYGADAFAGIVNIITIPPGAGKSGFRVGYGDHQQGYGSAWASAREGDFAYRLSAGYTRYPRWTREVAGDRIDLETSGQSQDLGAQNVRIDLRASQRLGPRRELDVGAGYARSELDIYGIGPFNDYNLEVANADVAVAYRSEHVNARAYYANLDGYSLLNAAYLGHTLYAGRPRQHVANAELEFVKTLRAPASVVHDFHIGLGYRLKATDWSYLHDDMPIEHHGSVFLQDSMRLGERVTLVASGRLDYVPYLERLIPSPRGSVIVKPTDRQAIRLSGSTAFRSPTALEAYVDLPIQLALPGLELLSTTRPPVRSGFIIDPEQIITAEASYLNQQSDYFEFEVTAYYNRVSDLIVLAEPQRTTLSQRAQGVGGLNPETGRYTSGLGGFENQCDVYHVVGGELGGRVYPVEGLDVFANYALNLSQQQRPDGCDALEDRRTSQHKVNAGVQVRTPVGVDGEVTFHYQSSQAWAEQVPAGTVIATSIYPLPAYTLLNARLGYRFLDGRAEISATVFNALDGIADQPLQMHPFGNRIGRRFMGFFRYSL